MMCEEAKASGQSQEGEDTMVNYISTCTTSHHLCIYITELDECPPPLLDWRSNQSRVPLLKLLMGLAGPQVGA